MAPKKLTCEQYWNEVQSLALEIEDVVVVFHTYEEINRLALKNKRVFRALNRDPGFWKTQMHCLQATLFISLSRILENQPDALTIHSVLNATMGNLDFFSATALATRKMRGSGSKPEWLDEFIANAWIPKSAEEIKRLKKNLSPHVRRFEEVYQPIRHSIFAHKLITNDHDVAQLFTKTNRKELGKTLDYLSHVIDAIRELYLNGTKPKVRKRSFKKRNEGIRKRVARVMKSLPQD